MKNNLSLFISFPLILFLFFVFQYFFPLSFSLEAGSAHNVRGEAWSLTVGAISMNSLSDNSPIDYGVSISESTGIFSGYAWSSNIGWISFNGNDVDTECPSSSTATLNWTTGAVTGFARAINGTPGGDWDGCIKLSGSWSNPVSVNRTNNTFSGYAWGDEVIGWVDFSGVSVVVSTPTLSLSASPNPVSYNTASTLSWNSTNTTSCDASGDWAGVKSPTGSESTGSITTSKTYTLTCTGVGGATQRTASVTVNPSQCSDGVDNEGDGVFDYPNDPGCSSLSDNTENTATTQCQDGVNNDGDSGTDYPADTGCTSPTDNDELDPPDFALAKNRNISVTVVAGNTESNTAVITVSPNNTFTSAVALSVTNPQAGWVYEFSDTSLSQVEYGSGSTPGSELTVTVPVDTVSGQYSIDIQGVGGGLTRTISVTLLVTNLNPDFQEF